MNLLLVIASLLPVVIPTISAIMFYRAVSRLPGITVVIPEDGEAKKVIPLRETDMLIKVPVKAFFEIYSGTNVSFGVPKKFVGCTSVWVHEFTEESIIRLIGRKWSVTILQDGEFEEVSVPHLLASLVSFTFYGDDLKVITPKKLERYIFKGDTKMENWDGEFSKEIMDAPMKYTKCHECGEIKLCKYVPDPFLEEIYGDKVPRWLCKDCYLQACDEI